MAEVTVPSIKDALRFPFRGPDWTSRFVVGSLLLLASNFVPILPGILVYGYVLRVMNQAIRGEALRLPAWDDWGDLVKQGLRGTAVSLVYLLPAMIVMVVGFALYFAGSIAMPAWLSVAPETAEAAAPLIILASMAILFLSMCFGIVLLIAGAIFLPMATAHAVAENRLSAAFSVREWWPLLRRDALDYFVLWMLALGLLTFLYTVTLAIYYTLILCCLLPFIAAPLGLYVSLVIAALFGQYYRGSTLAVR